MKPIDYTIAALRSRYLDGTLTPSALDEQIAVRLAEPDQHRTWIRPLSLAEMLPYAQALASRAPADLPLYGIPFALKDNIDLAGIPTTAGCPEFAYTPQRNAGVVE